MYDFIYQRPTSLDAAIKALGAAGDGKYLAGGMTLIPTMKQRLAQPSDLIDLSGIDGLSGIRREGDELVIGATTTHAEVAASDEVRAAIPIFLPACSRRRWTTTSW
jgi:carbon-monoxide dehydrogenase medium subunit